MGRRTRRCDRWKYLSVHRTVNAAGRGYQIGSDHDPVGASPELGNRSKGVRHGTPFSLVGQGPLPMPPPDPHHEQKGTASPQSTAPEKPRGTLAAMRRQLEQHSALEDLGPLFDLQAQGDPDQPGQE